MIEDIVRPLALTAGLLARYWPQLLLVGAIGYIARDLLLEAAVTVGLQHPLGGMLMLSLVVLAKLLVVVTMFAVLRSGLPALAALRRAPTSTAKGAGWLRSGDHMLAITAAVILPFFAYYAAWGFLGDTVREYSRLALDRVAFGEKLQIFQLLQSRGLIASVVACWAIRWAAKRMNDRSQAPWWRLVIVAADASWIFIGLYALDIWKDDFIRWLGAGSLLEELSMGLQSLSMMAHAAEGFTPVEFRQPSAFEQAQNLFFYALLPMIWLVMAAIINGYDLSPAPVPAPAAPSRAATSRAGTWRKWLHDFAAHFLGSYRARYRPVWTCLTLTLSAGLATLVTFIVAYRALNWLGAWLWYGATRTLGPYDLSTWQVVVGIMSVFIGSPSDLDGGILLDAVRIALLAAVLEHAVATRTRQDGRTQAVST
ncbi:hypothetical protein [Mesorhizobium sp. M9A.F.Ca.ET.002.03.1.2]|uniref:hypothetical protein n=1 Tax=Mesorhizobium sp. M9A.F.Ca.ET.002.03.1.2 TaxID=2493668 RepID=UPI001FE1E50A|nr:hypothetical protein [Mesorhizobium sp. M9A.F.Ca.ET.002.03.1.2]